MSDNSMPTLRLFVKAGTLGSNLGCCHLSQQMHMIATLKTASGKFNLSVAPVDFKDPAESFKQHNLKNVPAIVFQNTAIDDPKAIISFFDNNFTEVDLSVDDILSEKSCRELYGKFCFYMKSMTKDKYPLESELERLDKHLAMRIPSKGKFISGDSLSYLDCYLAPKLYQILVAGPDIKSFTLSKDLHGIWTYLTSMFGTEAFRQSCPNDEEILIHWMDRTDSTKTVTGKTREELVESSKSSPTSSYSQFVSEQPLVQASRTIAQENESDISKEIMITDAGTSVAPVEAETVPSKEAIRETRSADSVPLPQEQQLPLFAKETATVDPLENDLKKVEAIAESTADILKSLDDLLKSLESL